MVVFVNEVISSVIQIVLFALVPFVWWLIAGRKKAGFFEWIGLKWNREKKPDKLILWVLGCRRIQFVCAEGCSHCGLSVFGTWF